MSYDAVDIGALADVGFDRPQLIDMSEFLGGVDEPCRVDIRDDDPGAIGQEARRAGLADAACRAGDGDDLAGILHGTASRTNCSWSNSALRAGRERGGFSGRELRT
ncbi:hypothetical protein BLN97_42235 [Bradyrhizobium elkanii]|nr:hypothetical protein BLN97_42235 [Bradyrhizobium elkanii]